jgi:hypothetical protein
MQTASGGLIQNAINCKSGAYNACIRCKEQGVWGAWKSLGGGINNIPAEYTELPYIESRGKQYIDTGFKPNQSTRVVCKAICPVSSETNWLFGARYSASSDAFGFCSSQKGYYAAPYNTGSKTFDTSFNSDEIIVVDCNKGVATLKANGLTGSITGASGNFDCNYNIRENLPNKKGLEAKNNTAPMQRGLLIDEKLNNIGIITKGLTQYEVFENKLYLPILRATGMISNPNNVARTTPAGPPIEVSALQMMGKNRAEFFVFFGNQKAFGEVVDTVYNYIIV